MCAFETTVLSSSELSGINSAGAAISDVMAAAMDGELDLSCLQLDNPSPILSRLNQAVADYSQAFESEDFRGSDAAVSSFVSLIDRASDFALSDLENVVWRRNAFTVLSEVQKLIDSPPSSQADFEGIYLALPKVVAKFAGISTECRKVANAIIGSLVDKCDPRDMITSLCEALDYLSESLRAPVYFVSLFDGLSTVLSRVKRRHFEIVKVVVSIVLNVLKDISIESDDTDEESPKELVAGVFSIAASIQGAAQKLDGRREELHALLGLYVLQTMALITSNNLSLTVSVCTSFVLQLSALLPFCNLSYLGLITRSDVDRIINVVSKDEDGGFVESFPFVMQGACLSVIWAYICDEVPKVAKEDFDAFKFQLLTRQTIRWQAVGKLGYVLSSVDQSWEIKNHTLDFLLYILDEKISHSCDVEESLCYLTSLFTTLQAIQRVMVLGLDAASRKKAFTALKKVLADIPSSQRFDILKALIENSSSSSMTAILLDIAKDEVHMENSQNALVNREILKGETDEHPSSRVWGSNVLEFVGFILKPPEGGYPSLPEHSEAVVSALNLYRFLLISASMGQAQSKVLSEASLRKAYTEWLLPLRTLVSRIEAENANDHSEIGMFTTCSLNPVELVLYRCIELVEEHLKQVK